MQKNFLDILAIARENVNKNPTIVNEDVAAVAKRYSEYLSNEVKEVLPEIKIDNEVYLTDELADVVWTLAVLLVLLERRGLITDTEGVFAQTCAKYTERSPAFLEQTNEVWDQIKMKQKQELKERHQEKYGN